jgi:hypothetical protein
MIAPPGHADMRDFARRQIATRYDKLATNFASAVALVAVVTWWVD